MLSSYYPLYEGAGKKYFDKFPNITREAKITKTLPKTPLSAAHTLYIIQFWQQNNDEEVEAEARAEFDRIQAEKEEEWRLKGKKKPGKPAS